MFEIEIAQNAGFCPGVRRAVEIAEKAAEENGAVFTLGELIHNETVVEELKKRGITPISDIESARGGALVIRSHGVPRRVEKRAGEICGRVYDATCPSVKKIHEIASRMPEDGALIIIGERSHPEVAGIAGNASCEVRVFSDGEAALGALRNGEFDGFGSVSAVVQTTFDRGRFEVFEKKAKEEFARVEIHNTICGATALRQESARQLAQRAALMVVIGGRSSSNTKRLADICGEFCKTELVTGEDETFVQALKALPAGSLVGITAGASTPRYIIKEVHRKMNEEKTRIENNEEDFASLLEQDQSFTRLYTGKRVRATVVSVSKKDAVVEVGAKQTGYIVRDELTNDPNAEVEDIVKPGDVIDAVVIKVDDNAGTVALSKKRVDAAIGFEKLAEVKEENRTIEGVVSQVIKGGVIVVYENTKVFIPGSHTGIPRNGKLEELLKKTVKFKIIEVSSDRGGRVVGSIRQAVKEIRDAEKADFWNKIEVGMKFEGEVRSIESYGVFVDIGAIDGLVHTADLSWNRVGHPKDIVKVGDKINVIVKSFDPEKKRVSLSAKDPSENPWNKFVEDFHNGDVVKATVVSITDFGAFAQIIPGVDGLIHISQISSERVADINTVLSVGQAIDVKIIEINNERERVSLSIRALTDEPEAKAEEAPAEE